MQVTYCARIKSILSENAVHAMIINLCVYWPRAITRETSTDIIYLSIGRILWTTDRRRAHPTNSNTASGGENLHLTGVKYVISYVKSFDSSSNAYGAHVNGISPTYCSAAFSTSKWLILRTKSKDEKGHCLVDETIVHVIKREFCPDFNYRINNVLLSLPLSWIILPV